jgi:hypothetical protein
MRDERFTENEIDQLNDKINNRNQHLLKKYVFRWQHKIDT